MNPGTNLQEDDRPTREDHHDEPIVVDNRPFHLDIGVRHNTAGSGPERQRPSTPFHSLLVIAVNESGVERHGPFRFQEQQGRHVVTLELGDEDGRRKNALTVSHLIAQRRAVVALESGQFREHKNRLKDDAGDWRLMSITSPGMTQLPALREDGAYKYSTVMVIVVPESAG